MLAIFLALLLHTSLPVAPASSESYTVSDNQMAGQQDGLYHLVQEETYPESIEQGDEDAYKPYEGFNIVAVLMIALALAAVVFVVIKVFQRMNKSRRGDR